MKLKFLLPLIGFLVLVGFLAMGLTLNPREIPSALINKPVPEFRLARLDDPDTLVTPDSMRSQVWLLNVWASWCVACKEEHPVLVDIAQAKHVPLIGFNYKEARGGSVAETRGLNLEQETALVIKKATTWLTDFGDPYQFTVLDVDGRAGIDLGVYGVPETFLIDQQGNIRYKHMGAMTAQVFETAFLPRINELLRANK